MPYRLAPCDLGDPGWGIPGFCMVLLLLHSPSGMTWFLFDVLPSVSAAIPCRDDTMLSSLV